MKFTDLWQAHRFLIVNSISYGASLNESFVNWNVQSEDKMNSAVSLQSLKLNQFRTLIDIEIFKYQFK